MSTAGPQFVPSLPYRDRYDGVWGPPRLQTRHLFAWFATSMPLMALACYFFYWFNVWPLHFHTFYLGAEFVFAILGAGAWVVCWIGTTWRSGGHSFFAEPGQWLLVDIAARTLVLTVLLPIWIAMDIAARQGHFSPLGNVPAVMIILGGVLLSIVNAVVAFRTCDSVAWRLLFLVKSLFPGVLLFVFLRQSEMAILVVAVTSELLLLTLSIFAALGDIQQKTPRHWTHWFGLIAHAVLNGTLTASLLCTLIPSWS
jgi:hypothetical protein